ncbi:MAG: 5-formyltetrahydrofolate cyclo-ligase [Clostridia bacterium]|nr:5-formyltetrahydrofolate cyclo-ligase [Clostridia bacterium]
MDKRELRKIIRSRLAELSPAFCAAEDTAVVARILQNPLWHNARSVFCYLPYRREINTFPLLEAALKEHKLLALPRIIGQGVMEARLVENLEDLLPGCFGIPEPGPDNPELPPRQIDLVIVPGLAYERRSLLRLGQGQGFYDRYLAHTGAFRLAPARACQVVTELVADCHDLPMDLLVTADEELRRA